MSEQILIIQYIAQNTTRYNNILYLFSLMRQPLF